MKYLLIINCLFISACACMGGIGVRYDKENKNAVSYIYPKSPAEKADVHLGDKLLYPEEMSGKPGTDVNIEVIRDNKHIVLKAKRECAKHIKARRDKFKPH